jgi:serine/threonine protein kinase
MNLLQRWKSATADKTTKGAAHMTFVRSAAANSLTHTRRFLSRQIWVWPIIAFVLLSTIGFMMRSAIESTMKQNVSEQLQSMLRVEAAMLVNWYESQIDNANVIATDPDIRAAALRIINEDAAGKITPSNLDVEIGEITTMIRPSLESHEYSGYIIADREGKVIASSHRELIGMEHVSQYEASFARVRQGETVVGVPHISVAMLKDESGALGNRPSMLVCAPIRDNDFHTVGILAMRIEPLKEFSRILKLGWVGRTGETYAINREGTLVTSSRFDEQLILLGILPDTPNARSMLQLQARNPGGDMLNGFRPKVRRSELPLTVPAADIMAGNNGVNVVGYNDYRGQTSVGAWMYLPKFEVGIVTEIDSEEAFKALTILRRTFWSMYTLLVLTSIGIFIFTVIVSRMRREAQKAAIQTRQLGQYQLEKELGAGAMGVVYKGYHAMMRRPTAIKLLNVDAMNDSAIQRFEHEVQITAQLNHPNTIAIYDYGRTPEGVFYYAMEYLDGIDLQRLVEQYGPQPESRTIQILLQICGSLYEAHAQGLVHRDIKPANIMLNRRGNQPDMVKVLDFGLVKNVSMHKGNQPLTQGMAGTPLYLSPEAIQSPDLIDACSDLYAVGAVGYFLATGKTVFDAESLSELLQKHITETPVPPSIRSGRKLSEEFDQIILSCLEKSRARRPQTARDLAAQLQRCKPQDTWTLEMADAWWSNHDRRQNQMAGYGDQAKNAQQHDSTASHPSPTDNHPKAGKTETNLLQTLDLGTQETPKP